MIRARHSEDEKLSIRCYRCPSMDSRISESSRALSNGFVR